MTHLFIYYIIIIMKCNDVTCASHNNFLGCLWFEADVSLTLFIGGDDLKETFEQVSFHDGE